MRRLLPFACLIALAAPAAAAPTAKDVQAVTDKAYEFLKARQKPDGTFVNARAEPGATALIAAALVRLGKPIDDPVVAKALAAVEKSVQKDGGIYNQGLENYTTAIALVTFKEANKEGKYDAIIAAAGKYLQSIQNKKDAADAAFGGYSYGPKMGGPDVSNTHFSVEALVAAGVSKDDPAIRDALVFLGRCQNLPGESNKLAYATKTTADDKGGFVYNPAMADGKKKGKPDGRLTPEGGLRSEGGMTYAGLKSFLYAGVGKNDARVQAAIDWIKRHYTLEENPGQKDAGLFYYYHVFAKAFDALGEDEFTDANGKKHDWRQELFDTLKGKQAADGSWVNSNGAFMENSPELATSFALLSLSYAVKK